jgi:hypothetical protein
MLERRSSILAIPHPGFEGMRIASKLFGPHQAERQLRREQLGFSHPAEADRGGYCILPNLLDELLGLGPGAVR